MSREDKHEILDFVNFYVVLGIVRLSVLSRHIGVSQRTIQRWNLYGVDDKRKGAEKQVVRKLTEEERDEIYRVACSEDFKDLNPHEIYNSLLDKGIYLASESSFYRILRERGAVTHRRETKEGTSRKKPDELKATAKNQVWMWDITWIKTIVQGLYYYAYVIEDLFDRSIVGWAIYENESDEHAKELFALVTQKENSHPQFVHSDNGNAMKGITLVAFYYRLGIVPSFSRPRVSDDNPYTEYVNIVVVFFDITYAISSRTGLRTSASGTRYFRVARLPHRSGHLCFASAIMLLRLANITWCSPFRFWNGVTY